ncbi:hypothetical protein [Acidimangrovimonas pyrenivorans]|uniref:Uncharacterized protein n=1 Tax=Acidimangrovimonas pyrenivorans TaxID=2030798 RepID=A0ABV7AL03_9RHOB
MKTERRWMKWVLAESAQAGPGAPALPWQRGNRRRPASLRTASLRTAPRPKPTRTGAAR